MKFMYRALKDPVDAAISAASSGRRRVVDFRQAFCIPFDRQDLPLAAHVQYVQDVVENLLQRQRGCRSALATTQVWQDKFFELRFAQFRRNRLAAWVTPHSTSPNIWTLTDLPSPITNPFPARITDKSDDVEKLATS